jgi:hypothetical protein
MKRIDLGLKKKGIIDSKLTLLALASCLTVKPALNASERQNSTAEALSSN